MAHRTIGILGGLSPESTASYYLRITRQYVARHGDDGYPEILIHSACLKQFHDWRNAGRWDLSAARLAEMAESLRLRGADFGLIASNTPHRVFDEVQAGTDLPLLHILEPVSEAIRQAGQRTVALLGTRVTMGEAFYKDGLAKRGIDCLIPKQEEQAAIHRIINEELVRGVLRDESRRVYQDIIARLADQGAEGVVLGCTEIPLLIEARHSPIPVYDTAVLHADAALERATHLS
ncbi:aspartate/glutamate racemase family protein [Chromobacterium sp. IIBBL 290-4]|uniref:aspartate/glutamate racemase family protein n=1 Tax=Chromobacterium sp. IIBBL 290-4 TaxID=2953890 RepID=UPI0020B78ABD|nr:amino acid racemase [Chromobacterium sp. IIBBL 290-4]UTH73262.1 amino acid racemase [Chromobacterium sp. IIBBL 290-4]